MSRYALQPKGVWDNQTNALVLPFTPEWSAYMAWTNAGNSPDPYTPPPPPAPTAAEIAADAERATRMSIRASIKGDNFIQQLRTMTPADVDAYIQNNVTDLASAKVVLRKLAYVIAILAREQFQ